MTQYPVPDKPGLYWAKYQVDKEYNMIVRIMGTAPFFRARAWYTLSNNEDPVGFIPSDMLSYVTWGPEIPVPEVDEKGESDA